MSLEFQSKRSFFFLKKKCESGEEELNEDSETDESNASGSESSSDSPSAAAPSQAKSKKPIRLHKVRSAFSARNARPNFGPAASYWKMFLCQDDVNNIESNDNHSLVMERQQEDAIPQRERLYDFHGGKDRHAIIFVFSSYNHTQIFIVSITIHRCACSEACTSKTSRYEQVRIFYITATGPLQFFLTEI
jgi:hypothetical protein